MYTVYNIYMIQHWHCQRHGLSGWNGDTCPRQFLSLCIQSTQTFVRSQKISSMLLPLTCFGISYGADKFIKFLRFVLLSFCIMLTCSLRLQLLLLLLSVRQADCHQRVRRKSQVLAQSVLGNLQNKELCPKAMLTMIKYDQCCWHIYKLMSCDVQMCDLFLMSKMSKLPGAKRRWNRCNDCNGRWYHKTPKVRHPIDAIQNPSGLSWEDARNTLPGRLLGILAQALDILRLIFRCHDTSAAIHGCSHSFSVRVSLSLQLQSAGVNDVHVLLWRFWPTRPGAFFRIAERFWTLGISWNFGSRHHGWILWLRSFVGQRPSSRLKWGTLHSELKLSMSTLSVATRDSFWHTLTIFDYIIPFKAVFQYDDYWNFVQWPWLFLVFAQAQWQIQAQTLTLPIAKKARHHQTVTMKRSVPQCLKKWFIACETRTQLEVRTEDLIIIS